MYKISQNQPAYQVERDYSGVKANELLQKNKFNLSVSQKILLYLISNVSPEDGDSSMMEFDVAQFCCACGINIRHHKNLKMVTEHIVSLSNKSWWMPTEDGLLTKMRWIEKAKIDPSNQMVYIQLDSDLRPYLLRLQESYTKYELVYALRFKSKYSVRLYELINSIYLSESAPHIKHFGLEELRNRLGVDYYDKFGNVTGTRLNTWQHFRDRAFVPAVEEINEFSDKLIDWRPIKAGRSIAGISLKVSVKPGCERFSLRTKIDGELEISGDLLTEDW